MGNKNTVSIMFDADGSAVIKTSDGIEKKITGSNRKIEKDTRSATRKISGYWKAIGISAAAASAMLAVKRLSASTLEAASTSEQYRVRLQHLLGSQAEGNRLFKEMSDYAGKVPFEYENIMGAATQLSGVMKGGVDEVKAWMPMIGDLAAVSGMSIEETTGQVVRMYSAGAASADMFRERGILSMLGFKAGVSYTAEETRKKLMEEWNKQGSQFKGATADLATTWSGLTSMMADAWFAFRTKVAEAGVFNYAKAGLGLILKKIEELKKNGRLDEWAKRISDSVINMIKTLALGAAGVADTFNPIIRGIWKEISFLWDQFKKLPTWVQGVGLAGALIGGKKGAVVVGGLIHITGALKNSLRGLSEVWSGNIKLSEFAGMNADELKNKLEELDKKTSGPEAVKLLPEPPDPGSYAGKVSEAFTAIEKEMERLNAAQKAKEDMTPYGPALPSSPEGEGDIDEMMEKIAEYEDYMSMLRDKETESLMLLIEMKNAEAAATVYSERQKAKAIMTGAKLAGQMYAYTINQLAQLVATGKFSAKAFAAAMFDMAANAIIAVGQQATVKAIMAHAEAAFFASQGNMASAAAAEQAASFYTATAVQAGIAGVAMKAAATGMQQNAGPQSQPVYQADPYSGAPADQGGTSPGTEGQQPQQKVIVYKTVYNVEGNVVDHADFVRELAPFVKEAREDQVDI